MADIIVLFPVYVPIYVPRSFWNAVLDGLSSLRVIPPRQDRHCHGDNSDGKTRRFVRLKFPLNFVTAPLIADLFLLAISAIGKKEVHDGTVGTDHIYPIDVMAFFITLAYIAISIDASGLIRYLAFMVLKKGGKYGQRLFFYLYCFFFGLASFIGNDPIVLSGTPFLAYMTRVSENIEHPKAWIYTQFAVANIGSAILVSSNPTNLVLAGAFGIKFIDYTANIIVPVLFTAILLFPFLLWIVFPHEALIPSSIKLHELPEEAMTKKAVNPNIPYARGSAMEEEDKDSEQGKHLSLEEIMNPFLDKWSAGFGAAIMAVTLITILVINAADQKEHPVYWVTLPAAVILFCWDVASGWLGREETRKIAKEGRRTVEEARRAREDQQRRVAESHEMQDLGAIPQPTLTITNSSEPDALTHSVADRRERSTLWIDTTDQNHGERSQRINSASENDYDVVTVSSPEDIVHSDSSESLPRISDTPSSGEVEENGDTSGNQFKDRAQTKSDRTCLVYLVADWYRWCQETFPTVTAVLGHLPYALVPFALCMFVLVQALTTKGWVPVFAYGWDHWVKKTGTVGAVGGMGCLSVIMCNVSLSRIRIMKTLVIELLLTFYANDQFAGTNIGTTILLCRVIQDWVDIHSLANDPVSQRTFWATVYSMALGVNYGAFSTAFSASLAGLLWRDILKRKRIIVRELEFARVNIRIIAFAMAVGCAVLIGEVYIVRDKSHYAPKG